MKFNNKTVKSYFLFLLNPLFSLYYNINSLNIRQNSLIVFLFCGFLGNSIVVFDNNDLDSTRYKENLINYYYSADSSIYDLLSNLYKDADSLEITSKLISLITSKFTTNYHLLFIFFGLFFGYFLSKNLQILVRIPTQVNFNSTRFFIWAIFFSIPVWYINGFDFWAACQVFIFSVLNFFWGNKLTAIFSILLCALTHYAFLITIPLVFIFYSIRSKEKLLIFIFFFSFLLQFFVEAIIKSIIEVYAPEFILLKAQVYLFGEENFIVGGRIMGLIEKFNYIVTCLFFFCTYYYYRKLKSTNELVKLYSLFVFFFLSSVNILSSISILARFKTLGVFMALSSIFLMITESKNTDTNLKSNKYLFVLKIAVYVFNLSNIFFSFFPLIGLYSLSSNVFFMGIFGESDFVLGNILDLF